MPNLTLDQILDGRLPSWFPTAQAGINVQRIRDDLADFARTIRKQMADDIEALPRYEPELRTRQGQSEAAMSVKAQGQPASFIAIQDVRRLVNG